MVVLPEKKQRPKGPAGWLEGEENIKCCKELIKASARARHLKLWEVVHL